jgi:rhodanese-related sulfurtransferase
VKTLRVSLVLAICSTAVSAQDVTTRLGGRVSPEVAALVQQLATSAAARGLPVDPLIQKAIEGSAKGVPADRVAIALRALSGQLDAAAAALKQAGAAQPDTDAIAAGAFALNAGLSGRNVTALALVSRPSNNVAATLRVASTLAAMGVPAAEVVELVTQVIASGGGTNDVLGLPTEVMAGVSRGRGVTPAQAAAGLARAAAARANAPGQQKPKHPHP